MRRLILVALLLSCAASPAASGDAPLSAIAGEEAGVPSPRDGASPAEAAAVGVPVLALGDGWTWCGARREQSSSLRGLARLTQRLGDLRVVGPALLASYVTGRVTGLPDISAASARVAGATLGAAVVCGGLNLTVGRAPGSAGDLGVSGRREAAFPSGQTTIAFAAASAVDAEAGAHWVPWVVYSVAGAVGLAQLREEGHGIASVTAGAALGMWTGRKLDEIERGKVRILDRARFLVRGSPRDFRLGFKTKF